MYEEHPTFIQPKDENIKVWRYIDFTKLVSLMDSCTLYFTRADKFGDPFEGSWPKLNILARKIVPKDIPPEASEGYLKSMQTLGSATRHFPKYKAINCWHMNEHESAAMWKLYVKSDEAIAIQSTYSKLKKSLIDDEAVLLGVIKYIDYDQEIIVGTGNVLDPFVHKRKSFSYEQEVRALVMKWPTKNLGEETIKHGLQIKVDIETLVERIYVAPNASPWFADLVSSVVTKYGYSFEVMHSKLSEDPVF
ncbi:MAG: hypothetical protein ACR2PR_00845 [Pseudohongiellaceae bacterium]